MASHAEWSKIKHFRPSNTSDNWGNAFMMDFTLLQMLDQLRDYICAPIHVLQGTGGRHTDTSLHYCGQAVDIVVSHFSGHPIDLLFAAERFPFGGIGFYPLWKHKGIVKAGLHLDTRDVSNNWLRSDHDQVNFRAARWIGITKTEYNDGKTKRFNEYIGMTYDNLKKYIRL